MVGVKVVVPVVALQLMSLLSKFAKIAAVAMAVPVVAPRLMSILLLIWQLILLMLVPLP